jgi:hypothetical protein
MIPRGEILDARRRGEPIPSLEEEDLLVLGALADAVRREEIGDEVKLHLQRRPADLEIIHGTGIGLLRAVAIARITRSKGARIGVDWAECGFEIAQVALGFGANELVGPIQSKRGLPIADEAVRKIKGQGMVAERLLKKREIEGLIVRCRRKPVFVEDP